MKMPSTEAKAGNSIQRKTFLQDSGQQVASRREWLAVSIQTRVMTRPSGVLGIALVSLIMGIAVLAPIVSPKNPNAVHRADRLAGPSTSFLAGTDELGRDILSRVIFGSRVSLTAGLLSVCIGLLPGVLIGLVAGYFGGYLDEMLMRWMDLILAFPPLLLALFITAMLGSSLRNAMIAIGLAFIPSLARVTRSSVLTVKETEYVHAARMIGARSVRIMIRHILPNTIAPIIAQSTTNVGWAILTESALSFVGVGAQPPTASWGVMLSTSRNYLLVAPWTAFLPGVAIIITVVGFNLLGDWMLDALDPRLQNG